MSEYHEPYELIGNQAQEFHRALKSLQEELEAVDWYNQRVQVSSEPALKSILAHNRNEEIEHACMLLEWLRRNMSGWDEKLRTYLFTDDPIVKIEEMKEKKASQESRIPEPRFTGSLNIGKMKQGGNENGHS